MFILGIFSFNVVYNSRNFIFGKNDPGAQGISCEMGGRVERAARPPVPEAVLILLQPNAALDTG